MGIIDDYYGGYESLAFFTDEDGVVDFEAAYDAQLPDDDGYHDPSIDPWERAFDYKFNQVLRANALPGWSDTGRTTKAGKAIWEGSCSSCGKHTAVPFAPLRGGNPPQCKRCHAQAQAGRTDQQGGSKGNGRGRNKSRGSGRGGASSSDAGRADGVSSMAGGAGSSKAAEQGKDAAGVLQHDHLHE